MIAGFLSKKLSSFQIICVGFVGVILLGTVLLMLPAATRAPGSASWEDALFTATSAVCVTGLVVRDTALYWAPFGQAVILALIQVGGLGVVSVAAFFALISGKRIGLLQRSLLQDTISAHQIGGIVKLTGFLFRIAFTAELLGALLLLPGFCSRYGAAGIWMAAFHSVSAFCNAGFDIMGDRTGAFSSLTSFSGSLLVTLVICALITVGGIGFLTWDDVETHKFRFRRYRMQSKVILLLTVLLLIAVTAVGLVFTRFGFSEANIITVFILGVLIISVVTVSPVFSALSSLMSVLLFNWFFIEPKFSFHTYETEYVVTFGIMLISALITGTLANRLKENARRSAHEAFRAKVLFDTNQLLQKAGSEEEVIRITANQVITLLDRNVIFYAPAENGDQGDCIILTVARSGEQVPLQDRAEKEAAAWAFRNGRIAGSGAEQYGKARALYHPIAINDHGYGVIGIQMNERPLESFEYSVFMSILGECALALESLRNAAEKEQAAVLAHNEQLRANLLRSISHDIRTPLTSISGNASNLLSHYEQLDAPSREQIFADIYDDSQWLIHLVENLLSISRIENGQMRLHLSLDVVNDVIEEALRHADRKISEHKVTVQNSEELLLVRMDAGLITQVLINLINNAVKNTPPGSEIRIETRGEDGRVSIAVIDDGPGIPDEMKPHIFEMFYTGPGKVADGRRGMGLGLALCKSILEAHGGTIALVDNEPSGCRFICTLPMEEVDIHE